MTTTQAKDDLQELQDDTQWISARQWEGGPVERLPLPVVLDTLSRRILALQDRVEVAEERIVLRDQALERLSERFESLQQSRDTAVAGYGGPTGMYL